MIPLSWSRISDYRQCPHKFNLKYIRKEPNFQLRDDQKSIHLIRGNNVHKSLDGYVQTKLKGEEPKISSMIEVRNTIPIVEQIIQRYDVMPEQSIAIDENFQLVDWYSKNTWFRVIYDLIGFHKNAEASILVIDYKTGKMNDYAGTMMELGQLHMFGLVAMALWPDHDTVDAAYLYVDHKKAIRQSFIRERDFTTMKESLQSEHQKINEDQSFVAVKNEFCKWCDATSDQCVNKK